MSGFQNKTIKSSDTHVHDRKNSSFFKPFFQPKLTINQPNDVYEQEADAMADKVMRMPDASINNNTFFKPAITPVQRKCEHCEEEEKQMQRKGDNNESIQLSSATENYINNLSGGKPLENNERKFFESRMGYDFSNVRLHTDNVAAKSAQSVNALAYTTGNNIVFNQGRYAPETESGKKLMAHELTHVVQQNQNISTKKIQRVSDADVESGTGVDKGISNGTMTKDAIMGKNFDISLALKTTRQDFNLKKLIKEPTLIRLRKKM